MTEPEVTFTRVRRDINGRIMEKLAELGVEYTREGMSYRIAGELLTPGEAADRYLPGGFAGNFGRA